MTAVEEARLLADTEDALRLEFPHVPTVAIRSTLRTELDRFSAAKVRDFVPLLVTRQTRRRLRTHQLVAV